MAAIASKVVLSLPWVAAPKFDLGQIICYLYTVDDDLDPKRNGHSYHNIGFITGINWNPDSYIKNRGWVYTVSLIRCDCYPDDVGLDIEVDEEDIRLVTLTSGVKRHGR